MTVARQFDFSDLDLDFIRHPTTGDVVRKTGSDAIKRSVRNLIYTNFYEKPFRSHIGSNITKILFDNMNPLTANLLENAVAEVIQNYEPRVELQSVVASVNVDNNGYNLTLTYIELNRMTVATVNLFLERLR